MADVDGDRKADIVHVWNCNNQVCVMYYSAASGFTSAINHNTYQGTGAVAGFLTGDVYGDGRQDIIHLWKCDNNLCIMFYTAALGFEAHSYKTAQGTGAIRYMTGDVDGNGQTDVIQYVLYIRIILTL